MPNRIIKESICTSDTIDKLSWFEEVFFYRLIVNCDDYGRFDARPAILKARLFPLKNVTEKQMSDALNKFLTVGIVIVYEYDGKPYLQLETWEKHQRIRNSKEKYPAPEKNNLRRVAASCGELPPKSNPIQSESKSESIYKSEAEAPDCIITLTLNDKTEYPIFQTQIDEWKDLYQSIDVLQELKNMKGWLNSNPTKRKTKSGILRFVNGWLAKNQNSGGRKAEPKESAFEKKYSDPEEVLGLD